MPFDSSTPNRRRTDAINNKDKTLLESLLRIKRDAQRQAYYCSYMSNYRQEAARRASEQTARSERCMAAQRNQTPGNDSSAQSV